MKIAVLDFFTSPGGVGAFLARVLPQLAVENQVIFIDPFQNPVMRKRLAASGVRLVDIPVRAGRKGLRNVGQVIATGPEMGALWIRLSGFLKKWEPDILWTDQRKSALLARSLIRVIDAKHLHVAHGFEGPQAIPGYYKRAMRGADILVAVSKDVKRVLEQAGIPGARVIYHGVPVNGRTRGFFPAHRPVVGMVGALVPHKGFHLGLEALKPLAQANLISVELVGGVPAGADAGYAVSLKKKYPWAHYWGWQDDPQSIMRDWSVLVVPSLARESFCLVAAEAMALGVPVVAFDVGALAEVVGDAGVLVEPGDVSGLRRAVKKLIQDKALAELLSFRARQRVRSMFDLRKQVAEFEQVLKEVQFV